MLPIVLNRKDWPVAIVGRGRGACQRLRLLRRTGVEKIKVFSPNPSANLRKLAGDLLVVRRPWQRDLRAMKVLFITDMDVDFSTRLASRARALGVLVNTEDNKPLCDFYMPSLLIRGDLLVAISTRGTAPILARLLRNSLADRWGAQWSGRVKQLAKARQQWQAQGLSLPDLALRGENFIKQKKWLP